MLGQSLGGLPGIQTVMRFAALLPLTLIAFIGCTARDRSPDEIREHTARATSTAARDAKAAAQGVVEGLKPQRTININRASAGDLKSLPGIDDDTAAALSTTVPIPTPKTS